MDASNSLFDALRDRFVERLRFRREKGSLRRLAARPDGPWEPAEELLPESLALLDDAARRIRRGGHERVDYVYRSEVGMRFLCAVHSTARGPGAGGLRRQDPVLEESAVLQDLLNLSRAMSYKHAFAGNDRGGSKLCIHNTDLPPYARDAWLDVLAEEIDLSGTITGPDSGFKRAVYLDLAERSRNVTGARGGGTSAAAAAGTEEAIRACAAALAAPIAELKIAIQGLGGVGMPLAENLARAGAALVVTDRDPQRLDDLLGALTPEVRKRVDVVAPYQALEVEADILAPCALGGIISAEKAEELKVRAICGAANNQLVAESFEDERELAHRLHERGILYVPDWMVSAGGAIHGVMEFEAGEEFEAKRALSRIHRVCGWQVDEILSESRQRGHAPFDLASERFLRGLNP